MKLVLDTNIYCDYAEGRLEVVEALATHGESLFIPSIVKSRGKVFFRNTKGRRRQFNEGKLRQIINQLKIEVIDVTSDVAKKYGIIFLSLEEKGVKIPINDVWIAACCMEVGGTLLTRGKHFTLVDQIDVKAL